MLAQVKQDLSGKLPVELADALLSCYESLMTNYWLSRHEPSELNCGKFVEVCVRIIQHESQNSYTPMHEEIKDLIGQLRGFERLSAASLSESLRIHIPRVLLSIYNVRSKRGVAHLRGNINPNYQDATLLTTSASWVMGELFCIYYNCSLDEAQRIVDALVQKPISLVHKFESKSRVLLPELSYRDQTLLLLVSEYPNKVDEASLVNSIEPQDIASYRRKVLRILHNERLIEYDANRACQVLPPGLHYVDQRYGEWLERLN